MQRHLCSGAEERPGDSPTEALPVDVAVERSRKHHVELAAQLLGGLDHRADEQAHTLACAALVQDDKVVVAKAPTPGCPDVLEEPRLDLVEGFVQEGICRGVSWHFGTDGEAVCVVAIHDADLEMVDVHPILGACDEVVEDLVRCVSHW